MLYRILLRALAAGMARRARGCGSE